jgi:hypothetical protein
MDVANAFAESFDSFLLAKNSARAGAEALQDLLGVGGVDEDNASDLGAKGAHFAQYLSTVSRLVIEIVADYDYVDGHAGGRGQQFFRICCLRHDLQGGIAAQGFGQELGVNASAVRNHNADKVGAEFFIGYHRAS